MEPSRFITRKAAKVKFVVIMSEVLDMTALSTSKQAFSHHIINADKRHAMVSDLTTH